MAAGKTGTKKIAFLGGGNMAEALIRGLIAGKLYRAAEIVASDLSAPRLAALKKNHKIAVTGSNREAAGAAPITIVAVKPGQVKEVLAECREALKNKLVLSIAAGVPLAALQAAAPGARFIRVMPNTPALVGEGMSAFAAGKKATAADRKRALAILRSAGRAVELAHEGLLDAVTGLSGSGPAYVFLFIESLADGGVKAGLPRALAMELAVQTVLGSARLAQVTGRHPGELKDQVTSPGGTTIAGLAVLESAGFRGAVLRAVQAAADRSKELGQ